MAPSPLWRSALFVSPVLIAAVAVGCGGVEVANVDQPASTSVPASVTAATVAAPPTTPPKAGGTPFVAPDGRFSAQFPRPPVRAEDSGGGVTFIFYGGGDVFIGYGDYPKGELDLSNPLAVLRQKAEEAGILSRKDSTFLGRPAYEVVVRRPDEPATPYLHERSFIVGSRIYFLRGWSKTPAAPPEYATMLASFKLTS